MNNNQIPEYTITYTGTSHLIYLYINGTLVPLKPRVPVSDSPQNKIDAYDRAMKGVI